MPKSNAERQKAYRAKRQNLEDRLSDLEQRVAALEGRMPAGMPGFEVAPSKYTIGPSEGQGKGKVSVGKSKLGQSEKLVPRR